MEKEFEKYDEYCNKNFQNLNFIWNKEIKEYINKQGNKCINEFEKIKKIGEGAIWKVYLVKRYFYEENNIITKNYAMKKTHIMTQYRRRYFKNSNMITYFDEVLNEILILGKLTKGKEKEEENIGKEYVISLYELIYDNINREPFLYLINDYCDIGPIMNRDNINYNHFHNPNLIKFLFPNLNFEVEDFDNNLIKKNSLNLEIKHKIASKLFKEIFLGLKYIHSHNIIHRDIKIENLLFDSKENKIKIIDFSISTILFSKNNKIDEPGGSMHYQAPELQNIETNTNYNPFYADIWSVGICLYIFIFEEFPFDSDSELELQIKILENDIKLPFNPLNKFYENLLFQLLEKNPEKRLTDINKIIDSDYFKIS